VSRYLEEHWGTDGIDTSSRLFSSTRFAIHADHIQIMDEHQPACCWMHMEIPYAAIPATCFEPLRRLIGIRKP
jgi:hypothetical protein